MIALGVTPTARRGARGTPLCAARAAVSKEPITLRGRDGVVMAALVIAWLGLGCSDSSSPASQSATGNVIGEPKLTVVRDEYFHPTSWTVVAVEAKNGASQAAFQGSGELGNTGFYRRMVHELPTESSIAVTHRLLGHTFDPETQGAITSIDVEFDATLLEPTACGARVDQRFTLFQSGDTFHAALPAVAQQGWRAVISAGLAADRFRSAHGQTPDFGALGGTIEFGFERRSVNAGQSGVDVAHGLAALNILVHHL
jgi:hypothetical protein